MEKINRKFQNAYRARVGDKRFFAEDAPELNAGSMAVIVDALKDVNFIQEWPTKNFLLKEKGEIKKENDLFLLTMPCIRYRLTIAAAEEARQIVGAADFPEKIVL